MRGPLIRCGWTGALLIAATAGCLPADAPRDRRGPATASAPGVDLSVRVREFEAGRGPAPVAEAVRMGRDGHPWLVLILTGPDTLAAMKASDAFVEAGVDAVPSLLRVLDSATPRGRNWAAHALGRIGRPASAALPSLMKAETEPALRQVALEARRRIEGGQP
ncbi:MAG: HEAT repeat domain-containing protein [Candidatus Brocadiae bacterium]|nr:HEAT repeat domain-containing protein [Candidatus Brocadiia bacterium]